jgi:hypothetical protein
MASQWLCRSRPLAAGGGGWWPGGCGITLSGWSELAEEGQEAVGWLVTSGRGSGRCGPGYGLFLESHVGVQVDAGGGRIFVTEP